MQEMIDITDDYGLALTDIDIHKLAQTILADDDIPNFYSDREQVRMYLQASGIGLDVIRRNGKIWQKMAEKYGPIQGFSILHASPTEGFMVHGTQYLDLLLGSKGPHLLVPHGYGYDWIDKDLCGGDGSGEARKALDI